MKMLIGLLTLSILLGVSLAFGQTPYTAINANSFGFYGGGARAMAMGSAFIGLADDASGGSWNPAGIYQMDKPLISASYNIFKPRDEFKYDADPFSLHEVTNNNLQINGLNYFSFMAPVRIKGHPWVFNFNYIRNNNRSILVDIKSNPLSGLDPDSYQKWESYLQTFNFGFSTRLYDRLAFGVLANIYDARQTIISGESLSYDSVIYFDGSSINVMQQTNVTDSTASNGFNFLIGLMYKLDKMSFGATVRTPFKLKHSSDYIFEVLTTHQGLEHVYGTFSIFDDDNPSKQAMPLSVGFGVGLTPKENMNITLDFNFDKYGSVSWFANDSTVISPGGEKTDYYTETPIDWNNTFGVGSGIEYFLSSEYGQIPLRVGFRFNQLPQPKDFVQNDHMFLDDNGQLTGASTTTFSASGRQNMQQFSVGSGIHWAQIKIDFAYRYTSSTGLNILQTLTATGFEDEPATISNQQLKPKAHEINISFTGYF
ncbi:MAG: outer membrane protein transport protein [candidate division Zixibacteria bacterium]